MTPVEAALLRLLAAMPLLDRLEAAAISGWSRGAVYRAASALERQGLIASVPHATDLLSPTRRYVLTAKGIERLAQQEGTKVGDLLRSRPVSSRQRRTLLERLDGLAVIYRLVSAMAGVAHPLRFRWLRAMPMDAAVGLPGNRVLAVVRQGTATDRTGFAKRIWRLREGDRPGAALLLMPDETRLRHARRLLAGAPFPAFLALERDVAGAGPRAPIWRTPSSAAAIDLRTALAHAGPHGAFPDEQPPARASLPGDLGAETDAAWMLPSVLKPAEKRALDLIADWPWLTPPHLGALMALERSRLAEVLGRLASLELVRSVMVQQRRRLVLTDRALAVLARRDRASVGAARSRWSAGSTGARHWRSVGGARSRQLLRNVEHTGAVHWFIAVLARQAHARSQEVLQLDPPRRASRYFRHRGQLRSIHPDAFGILRRGVSFWAFFLEWERRAVRPATMASRLAPYLRYYSSQRPTDDHGVQPVVLVVFEDEIAQAHFLRVARKEMARVGVSLPLFVSHREMLEREGPLGRAWLRPAELEPISAFA